ncbi:MAG: hypothetical protein AAB909_00060 [Patescibacteria group bacterium]
MEAQSVEPGAALKAFTDQVRARPATIEAVMALTPEQRQKELDEIKDWQAAGDAHVEAGIQTLHDNYDKTALAAGVVEGQTE